MIEILFLEDIVPGTSLSSEPWHVKAAEIISFATVWDPLPQHLDESIDGGLTAPGLYMLAIKMALIHRLPVRPAVIASIGYDELRFLAPARPGDELRLRLEWIESRESTSKNDRGVVTHRLSLINQAGITAMTHLDTILVKRRNVPI